MSELRPLRSAPAPVPVAADEIFFASLVAGEPVRVAAERAGLGLSAAYRRLHRPEFQQRLAQARGAMTHELALRVGEAMAQVAAESVEVLRSVMHDPEASAAVRVNAAGTALRGMLRLLEVEEMRGGIVARLEALEADLGGSFRPSGAALRGERP